jgi:hypothetical protein
VIPRMDLSCGREPGNHCIFSDVRRRLHGWRRQAGSSDWARRLSRSNLDPNAYFIDILLRSDHPNRNDAQARAETARIFARSLELGHLPAADKEYLAQLVSANTGLSQAASEKRVSEVFKEVQTAADSTRKAVAHLSLWLFIALLIGAFCASYAATIGGRQRDHVQLVFALFSHC